jgi:hypothetical protein
MNLEEINPIAKAKTQGVEKFLKTQMEEEIKNYSGPHYKSLTEQEREEISTLILDGLHRQHSY